MAPPKKQVEEKGETIELGKIKSLTIKNFRAIGPNSVTIDLDNIVVLVGPNNAGKSSILRAYEVIMSGSGKLDADDFPNSKIDPDNLPSIEIETEIVGDPPGDKWIIDVDGKKIVKERWTWAKEGAGKRQGWNKTLPDGAGWDEKNVPWGAPNVANSRRPQPHAVKAFDPPDEQAKQINNIILTLVQERALSILADDESGESEFTQLTNKLRDFQAKVVKTAKTDIAEFEKKLTEMIANIFADHVVEFDPIPAAPEAIKLFASNKILVGKSDGYKGPLELQGSGARRTLLWSVLRIVSENSSNGQSRPHLLLIDEPELCLHPSAVREACRVLYDLADKAGWQVMVTTHHPAFIDLARDNKTIVRVERDGKGEILGTTLFKPSVAKLGASDRENLQLLNIYDPYVGEMFFGGHIIVVEGDTEYSTFRQVAAELIAVGEGSPIPLETLKKMHIIRARGKFTIVSLCKILNHFGSRYSILHDADTPTITVKAKDGTEKEQTNSAWTANTDILTEVDKADDVTKIRLVASRPNFELAYLNYEASKDKPYSAIKRLKSDPDARDRVVMLLHALLDHDKPLPPGAFPTREMLIYHAAGAIC